MNWIFDNLEVVGVIVIALGSAIKQLLESAQAKRQEQKRRDYGEEPDSREEEREPEWIPVPMPPEFRPPPLPAPEPIVRQVARPVDPDPTGDLLRQQLEMQEKAREFRKQQEQKSDKALQKTLDLERRARTAVREKNTTALRTGIRTQLASPSDARTAIALREILGKPVGLR